MRLLLEQHTMEYEFAAYDSNRLHSADFFLKKSLLALRNAKEISIDSTYRTNSQGAELYAVLGKLDGTGIPLAYMLKIWQPTEQRINSGQDEGDSIFLFQQLLTQLKGYGLDPAFIGSDKDAAELAAIKIVFPSGTRQLCQWHANRAFKMKVIDYSPTKPQSHYRPGEAHALASEIEICWGLKPIRRPDGPHWYALCECPSKYDVNQDPGRLEPDVKERDQVVQLFSQHFNYHPLIPDETGNLKSPHKFTNSASPKCISGVKCAIILGSGHISGHNGISQVSGSCRQGQ